MSVWLFYLASCCSILSVFMFLSGLMLPHAFSLYFSIAVYISLVVVQSWHYYFFYMAGCSLIKVDRGTVPVRQSGCFYLFTFFQACQYGCFNLVGCCSSLSVSLFLYGWLFLQPVSLAVSLRLAVAPACHYGCLYMPGCFSSLSVVLFLYDWLLRSVWLLPLSLCPGPCWPACRWSRSRPGLLHAAKLLISALLGSSNLPKENTLI